MSAQPSFFSKFIRKTQLAANEYHKNFFKLDGEIIAAITSAEADQVTPLMSKIYLRLVNAPHQYWEREGVLRFEAELREGKQIKAWDALCKVMGVASATANKALAWLHEQKIIGYFSGKNGVGLRVFLNRAISSIGIRVPSANQKNLGVAAASSGVRHASPNETAFKDSFAVLEVLDSDFDPHAPKNGADTKPVDKTPPFTPTAPFPAETRPTEERREVATATTATSQAISVSEIIAHLKSEIEPGLKTAAAQAASQAARNEIERTRHWFETKALPKAVRVAQSECYHILRKQHSLDEKARCNNAELEAGLHHLPTVLETPRSRTPEEINEVAEICLALLNTQGRAIDVTLAEISAEGGGWLLAEDAPKVRDAAEYLLTERGRSD